MQILTRDRPEVVAESGSEERCGRRADRRDPPISADNYAHSDVQSSVPVGKRNRAVHYIVHYEKCFRPVNASSKGREETGFPEALSVLGSQLPRPSRGVLLVGLTRAFIDWLPAQVLLVRCHQEYHLSAYLTASTQNTSACAQAAHVS
jgi:hypothetical protein